MNRGRCACAPLHETTKAIIRRLRREGLTVVGIGQAMGMHKASQLNAIRAVCEQMPRWHGFGELGEPRHQTIRTGRKRGAL